MQVRFISVNDNYDSISPECDNQMLGIMISNLANDMYAKDASVKNDRCHENLRWSQVNIVVEMLLMGIRELEMKKENLLLFPNPLTAPYVVEIFEKLACRAVIFENIRESLIPMLLASPRYTQELGKLFLDRTWTKRICIGNHL